MKITSSTDLEFPGLHFSIRQASVYIREVPEPESTSTRKDT
jgi:hypothetical protein